MFGRPMTDEEVWNSLPLSMEQREKIYNDFILTKQYDIKEDKGWGNLPLASNADTEEKKEDVGVCDPRS